MRRALYLSPIALLAIACVSEDTAPIYLDLEYQVRCVRCEPRSPDNPIRTISYLNGESGFDIDCGITTREGRRLISMEARFVDPDAESRNFALRIRDLGLDDKDPGDACEVTVSEGNNTYEGKCTREDPDAEHPCKVMVNREDSRLLGSVFCQNIPNRSNQSSMRHVVAPLETEAPAQFELHNCDGL